MRAVDTRGCRPAVSRLRELRLVHELRGARQRVRTTGGRMVREGRKPVVMGTRTPASGGHKSAGFLVTRLATDSTRAGQSHAANELFLSCRLLPGRQSVSVFRLKLTIFNPRSSTCM